MTEYRLAVPEDVPALARMRWDWKLEEDPHADVSLEEYLCECEAFLHEGLRSGLWVHWIAEEDGRLLSNASVCRVTKLPHPRRKPRWLGYVTNVCTVPDRRGQGIGAALLAHLVEWAEAEECDTLILWPDSRRTAFYERCGFHAENEVLEHTLE